MHSIRTQVETQILESLFKFLLKFMIYSPLIVYVFSPIIKILLYEFTYDKNKK